MSAYGADHYAWNVLRSDFDDILFRHATNSGAKAFDKVRVNSVLFEKEGDPSSRPIGATYTQKSDASSGEISFQYLVDATGRTGIMNTKYLKNRTFNKTLRNIAWWGYWQGTTPYTHGTSTENVPFFEALRGLHSSCLSPYGRTNVPLDESGWAWIIPLREAVSVGLVMNQDKSLLKRQSRTPVPSAQEFYLEQLKLAPNLWNLVKAGEIIDCPGGGARVKSASDYSYSAAFHARPGLRIVGDAGAFIDPFFSSGIHLATMGALSAAASISTALRGECSEEEAVRWHSTRITRR